MLALLALSACTTSASLDSASSQRPAQASPNVVIIYADDLGYGDLSCYNPAAAYETPHLDRMAAEGVRFTDAHSPSTICSPSRYGLLSGQQIYRSTGRGGGAWEGPGGPSYLKPGTLTLAQMLQQQRDFEASQHVATTQPVSYTHLTLPTRYRV